MYGGIASRTYDLNSMAFMAPDPSIISACISISAPSLPASKLVHTWIDVTVQRMLQSQRQSMCRVASVATCTNWLPVKVLEQSGGNKQRNATIRLKAPLAVLPELLICISSANDLSRWNGSGLSPNHPNC